MVDANNDNINARNWTNGFVLSWEIHPKLGDMETQNRVINMLATIGR